ncbi:uncharacterized protein LAESUDRAFT_371875 [Laetiporus sulphureus 93-53]|uniref:Uncharacterized protein n=1 Tax=Laetiporus sulphureus 93-53 TaxID=1314785 RepID=A0A165CR51_9APHY|nr:uncharacterized protein LAESUDRAFT_371875 [Laetiporus sulphureus 93-53]KZT03276.1 hypothetical protein LAESUDRAFT_371875 [Laetiporus sulphureus 93-53]
MISRDNHIMNSPLKSRRLLLGAARQMSTCCTLTVRASLCRASSEEKLTGHEDVATILIGPVQVPTTPLSANSFCLTAKTLASAVRSLLERMTESRVAGRTIATSTSDIVKVRHVFHSSDRCHGSQIRTRNGSASSATPTSFSRNEYRPQLCFVPVAPCMCSAIRHGRCRSVRGTTSHF